VFVVETAVVAVYAVVVVSEGVVVVRGSGGGGRHLSLLVPLAAAGSCGDE